MPSPKTKQVETFVMRSIPPGSLNKDKYYLILGNLPFEKDWKGLKSWLDSELQKRAPHGHENRYNVEYTSTLRLGTGWARLRGLDVFNTAVHITTKVPYCGRNLLVSDNNRDSWVQIMDNPYKQQDRKSNQSSENPVYGQPEWTYDPESNWEKYRAQYQQPTTETQPVNYASQQHQNSVSPHGYHVGSGYSISTAAQVSYPAPGPYYVLTSPQTDRMEQGYTTSTQQVWDQAPSMSTSSYVASEAYPFPQSLDQSSTPSSIPLQQHVWTERRQVMVRNIPYKAPCSSSSSSSSRRKDRPLSREEVRQWLENAVMAENYGHDLERAVVEHKSGDLSTHRGYGVLIMKSAAGAEYMAAALDGKNYGGKILSSRLGKEETTISAPEGMASPTAGEGGYGSVGYGGGGGERRHHKSKTHYHYKKSSCTANPAEASPPLVVSGSSVLVYGTNPRTSGVSPNKPVIAMGSRKKDQAKK